MDYPSLIARYTQSITEHVDQYVQRHGSILVGVSSDTSFTRDLRGISVAFPLTSMFCHKSSMPRSPSIWASCPKTWTAKSTTLPRAEVALRSKLFIVSFYASRRIGPWWGPRTSQHPLSSLESAA